MKWYHKVHREIIEKEFDSNSIDHIIYGLNLNPGDIISTCAGYNKKIKSIKPEIVDHDYNPELIEDPEGWILIDFHIITEDGNYCSWVPCGGPPETKQEIEKNFLYHLTDEGIKAAQDWDPTRDYRQTKGYRIAEMIKSDNSPFDENGLLTINMD